MTQDRLDRDLELAQQRLDRALLELERGTDLGAVEPASAEAELLRELTPGADAGLSFAAPGAAPSEAKARADEFTRVFDRIVSELHAAAAIQTKVEGRVVASTRIGLGGATVTTCSPTIEAEELARHQATVDEVMRTRHARMRLVFSVITAASKIAVAAGTGNLALALPAAWRFVTSVTSELKQAKASQSLG